MIEYYLEEYTTFQMFVLFSRMRDGWRFERSVFYPAFFWIRLSCVDLVTSGLVTSIDRHCIVFWCLGRMGWIFSLSLD